MFESAFVLWSFIALLVASLALAAAAGGRAWLGRLLLRLTLGLLRLSQRLMTGRPIATRRLHSASSEISWAIQSIPAASARQRRHHGVVAK